jgi:hypothetical protein
MEKTFQWIPIPAWPGRYRCAKTGVLGFRPSETKMASSKGDSMEISPYTCARNGCEEHASHRYKGKCYCTPHTPKSE